MADNKKFDEGLQKIRQRFLNNLKENVPVFEEFLSKFEQGKASSSDIEDARMRVHKWAGTAKTFGFPELTEIAAQVEYHLDELIAGKELDDALAAEILDVAASFVKLANDAVKKELATKSEQSEEVKAASQECEYHIVIADDDELVRDMVAEGMKNARCKVTPVVDGIALLKMLESASGAKLPNLIVLDINMPVKNGFEVLKELKKSQKLCTIPVVLLTREDHDESLIEGISSGAVDYITKPFSMEELTNRIISTLKKTDIKLLIADDDALIRDLLSHRFYRMGYTVLNAKNGIEAWDMIQKEKPNVTLLDVMMPGMDGFAVLKLAKDNEETADLPIILLTAKSQQENVLHGLESGAHDYITKPFDIEEVAARVSGILHRNKLS